ncbi:MAG: nuclear transport factor 2 family protein [Acidimicrobiales bacterium]
MAGDVSFCAMAHERAEIEATIDRYLELRRAAIAGAIPWSDLKEVFTDDAVFVDSMWGRHEGVEALVEFLDSSMRGLETWDFPHFWAAIDGDRVFLRWSNRLPGSRHDGRPIDNMGLSYLEYAGDGKFSYEEDMYSESHLMVAMKQSDWRPGPDMVAPPADRDWV